MLAVVLDGVVACGARTAPLVADAALASEPDAGPPEVDAGLPFFTFPCRWTLGDETVLVVQATPLRDVIAAVPLAADVALVMTADVTGTTGYRGALVSITDPPTVLRPVSHDIGGELVGLEDGWGQLEIGDAGCTLVRYDASFASTTGGLLLATSSACQLERRDARLLEVVSDEGAQVRLVAHALSSGVMSLPSVAVRPSSAVGASYDPRFGWIALSLRAGALELDRVPTSGGPAAVYRLPEGATALAVEPDRLRVGILVLRQDPSGRELLERLSPVADPPVLDRLLDVSAIGTSTGELVSTEAEAGIALRDGRVVFAPTSGTAPSVIGPVTSEPIEDIHIALRAGTSVGVVAYDYFDRASSQHRLAVRALSCNR